MYSPWGDKESDNTERLSLSFKDALLNSGSIHNFVEILYSISDKLLLVRI